MSCIITYFQHPQFHGWSPNIDVGHRLDPHIVYVTGNPNFKNTNFFFNQTDLIRNTCDMPLYYQKPPETNQISMFLLSFFPQHLKMKVRGREKKPRRWGEGRVLFSLPPPSASPPPSKKQTGKSKLLKGCVITTVIFPKTLYWLLSI